MDACNADFLPVTPVTSEDFRDHLFAGCAPGAPSSWNPSALSVTGIAHFPETSSCFGELELCELQKTLTNLLTRVAGASAAATLSIKEDSSLSEAEAEASLSRIAAETSSRTAALEACMVQVDSALELIVRVCRDTRSAAASFSDDIAARDAYAVLCVQLAAARERVRAVLSLEPVPSSSPEGEGGPSSASAPLLDVPIMAMRKAPDLLHHWPLKADFGGHDVAGSGGAAAVLVGSASFIRGAVYLPGDEASHVDFPRGTVSRASSFTLTWRMRTTCDVRLFDIIGNRPEGSNGRYLSVRMIGATGQLTVELDDNGGRGRIDAQSPADLRLNDGAWHAVGVSYATHSKSGSTTLALFVDGSVVARGFAAAPVQLPATKGLRLGRSLEGYESRFAPSGDFCDVRVYEGAVSSPLSRWTRAEVACDAALVAPPAHKALELLHHWPLNEDAGVRDVAGSGGAAAVLVGSAFITRETVRLPGDEESHVEFPRGTVSRVTPFTLTWRLRTSCDVSYFDIIGNRSEGSNGRYLAVRMHGATGQLTVELDDDGGPGRIEIQSPADLRINDDAWHAVAVSYDPNAKTGATLALFVDGALVARGFAAAPVQLPATKGLRLGRSLEGCADYFAPSGDFCDVRVYEGAVSSPLSLRT
jgi:hypothetical protein